jgi:hypothetical protein
MNTAADARCTYLPGVRVERDRDRDEERARGMGRVSGGKVKAVAQVGGRPAEPHGGHGIQWGGDCDYPVSTPVKDSGGMCRGEGGGGGGSLPCVVPQRNNVLDQMMSTPFNSYWHDSHCIGPASDVVGTVVHCTPTFMLLCLRGAKRGLNPSVQPVPALRCFGLCVFVW